MSASDQTCDLFLQHKPAVTCFEATVVRLSKFKDRPSLVLDRTAFYPESGGQLADRGTLGPHVVLDVQRDHAGVIHHIIQGSAPTVGCAVRGQIDLARRRLHMAQHTGQHLLSQVLLRDYRAQTRSSRLGDSVCTIDVDCQSLTLADAHTIECSVNELIDEDLLVDVFYPDRVQLDRLTLRRSPKVLTDIRVVAIGEVDLTPCGGTHCQHTSQVGLLLLTGIENYKGMIRVSFQAGQVARGLAFAHANIVEELSQEFSCSAQLVPKAISKLKKRLGSVGGDLALVRSQLAEQLASRLLQKSGSVVCADLGAADADLLREVSNQICAQPGRVALLAGQHNQVTKLVFRSSSVDETDCGHLMGELRKKGWAKGGGRAVYAEGVLAADQNWNQVVELMGLDGPPSD